eukprot:461103-Pleurochrysis_carterae.AAC.1
MSALLRRASASAAAAARPRAATAVSKPNFLGLHAARCLSSKPSTAHPLESFLTGTSSVYVEDIVEAYYRNIRACANAHGTGVATACCQEDFQGSTFQSPCPQHRHARTIEGGHARGLIYQIHADWLEVRARNARGVCHVHRFRRPGRGDLKLITKTPTCSIRIYEPAAST